MKESMHSRNQILKMMKTTYAYKFLRKLRTLRKFPGPSPSPREDGMIPAGESGRRDPEGEGVFEFSNRNFFSAKTNHLIAHLSCPNHVQIQTLRLSSLKHLNSQLKNFARFITLTCNVERDSIQVWRVADSF